MMSEPVIENLKEMLGINFCHDAAPFMSTNIMFKNNNSLKNIF